tara:strand:+ start:12895 stop:13167 length:273 start_codon:yes stop_codon:yes gene_type:complete
MKNWLWGEKDKGNLEQTIEGKVPLDFTAKNRRRDLVTQTISIHLELEMEYPEKMDIGQAIRDTKTTFDLPMGIELKDAHLAHIEILKSDK